MTTATAPARTPTLNGLRVAHETFWHGLQADGLMSRGIEGSDIAKFTFNRRTAFILKHPDYIDHVLHEGVDHYHKSIEYVILGTAVGLSLFTDEDESWRRHRMMLNPVLTKRHLTGLFDLMVDPIEAFLDGMDDGEDRIAIEMSQAMTALTLDVVGSALFGRGMADLAVQMAPMVTDGLQAAEFAMRLVLVLNPPVWLARATAAVIGHAPLLPPPLDGIQSILRSIDRTVWNVIHERQAHPSDTEDLLGLLLTIRDENGQVLPLRRVRDEAATFMLAGHETTANALNWMWYLLALNADARDRMLAEVDEVLEGRRPTVADLKRLPWTAACGMEAMRMFSPLWMLPRKCVKDDVIDGHRIPRGSTVLMPIDALHHDERFWDQPEVFHPARFLRENARGHHRSAYLPFGGGRRVCAGQSFAVMEMTLVTAMLSQRFVYDLVPGHPVQRDASFTLRPRYGLKMIARRRVGTFERSVAA